MAGRPRLVLNPRRVRRAASPTAEDLFEDTSLDRDRAGRDKECPWDALMRGQERRAEAARALLARLSSDDDDDLTGELTLAYYRP